MRHERCEVTTNRAGDPTSVVWNGEHYTVSKAVRTGCGVVNLTFREYWTLHAQATLLRVYSVEYGSAGHRTEKFWWLGAIEPDPRGLFGLY